MKTREDPFKSRNQGRNSLPFKNLENIRVDLFRIGISPKLQVKDLFPLIRFDENTKMSREYKTFKKLCPIYYGKAGCPILNMLDPFRAYRNFAEDKYLWTTALVKLTIDRRTEEEYAQAVKCSLDAKQAYYHVSEQSNSEDEQSNSEVIELKRVYEQKEHEKSKIKSAINSWNKKNLFVCLAFRGLLAYLFSEYELQNTSRAKKGKRNAKEKYNEKIVQPNEYSLNDSNNRIRQVIRNQSILEEAPFLRDSDLHESLGFDVIGLLLKISIELIGQLHIDTSNDFYLLKRAMERYLAEFDGFFFSTLSRSDPNGGIYHMHVAFVRSQEGVKSIDERSQEDISNMLKLNNYRRDAAEFMASLVQQEMRDIEDIVIKSISFEQIFKEDDIEGDQDAKGGSGMIFKSATTTEP